MNTLRITHETVYEYNRPLRFAPHRLVLRPREGHDLQVAGMSLAIAPAHSLEWSRDVFGNSIATVEFLASAPELSIISRVDIRRGEMPRLAERPHQRVPYPLVYDPLEAWMTGVYLAPVYPEDVPAVKDWARAATAYADTTDAAALATALNTAVFQQIRYARRDEPGVQSPANTLARGTGSCRDFATLLMESCRALGLAARFGSGYLDCPASVAGLASTHAWAEVYFPGRGWTGYDPTLGEPTSAKHIAVAVSHHPRGIMPITGKFYGSALDYLGMKVAVKFEHSPGLESTAARAEILHPVAHA